MYKLITAPAEEPVTVTELKSQLRITGSSQDTMLSMLIKSARSYVENYLRQQLVTATWEMYLDSFPISGTHIYIQKSPLISVTHIKYYDQDNQLQTLSATKYMLDNVSIPAKIYEAYNEAWPVTIDTVNAVVIKFIAGYGTKDVVPEQIKQAVLMLAASFYENPSDEVTGTQVNRIGRNSQWILQQLRSIRL